MTKQFDKGVYETLQKLRTLHKTADKDGAPCDSSQWEILQSAIVSFAKLPWSMREEALSLVRLAPSDQPKEWPVGG